MRHVPATVVILRPLDELGPEPPARARRESARARRAASGPAVGKRGVLEMLDLALEVLRARFALLVGLGALAWLPVRALQPFVGPHVWENSVANGSMFGSMLGTMVNLVGSALAQCLGAALLAGIVAAEIEGRELRVLPTLRGVLARGHVVVALALVTALATSLGTCACVLPGLFLAWKLSVAPMACVIERCGLGASLARSVLLTQRGFWRWAFLALASSVLGGLFGGLVSLADWPGSRAQVLAWTGLSGTSFDACFVLVSALLLGIATALHAAVLTVYYADARVRREGADLESQHAALRRAEGAA